MTESMTAADIAAVTGGSRGGMFGGDGAWWIVVLFLFAFMGWGNGIGGGNGVPYMTGAATQADLQRGFDQSTLVSKLDSMLMSQQECCCENRAAIADLKYTIATEACADRAAVTTGVRDIIDNQNAGFRSILDKMCQDKIDTLLAENNALKGQLSQAAQNAYLINALGAKAPIPAYVVQNPNGCGVNTGCGCGSVNY